MRILSLFIILSKLIFAQYDFIMYDLIKTTYERSFDKQILSNYLNSGNEKDIRAAVLSIAQSEDTTFVPALLKLDLNKFSSEVLFALAQIGKCSNSINFVWNYLKSSPPPDHCPNVFFAIGKIGNENDLRKLVEYYNSFDGPVFPFEGISEAILQFQIRGIISDNAKAILETEITNPLTSKERITKALFVLARYRNNDLSTDKIKELFNSEFANNDGAFLQFLLMNITERNGSGIIESDLLYSLDSASALTKIQLISVLHLIGTNTAVSNNEKIKLYLKLLSDSNENVAIQSAITLKNIKLFISDTLKPLIKDRIDSLIFNLTKPEALRGELFLSRFELFGNYEEHQSLLGKANISYDYFIPFYAKNIENKFARKKLLSLYMTSSSVSWKIKALEELVKVRDELRDSSDYDQLILFALNSNTNAPIISIAAEGIDSSLINNNTFELQNIISDQIDKFKNDPDFLEATMSLVNLAERIDKNFYTLMIDRVKSSKLYSLRKFVANKTGEHLHGFKELDKFEDIWENAFKYKKAEIRTTKGSIVIEFNSEIAPVSVANFCMLAKQDFYNGIYFHRVVPGFVIQAGDPTATGWGGPGYDIVSEFSDTDFNIGYVGMASAGKDTESSQFFIMQGSYPHLDSRYTLFGKVIRGMDVVFNITEEDKIISIELD